MSTESTALPDRPGHIRRGLANALGQAVSTVLAGTPGTSLTVEPHYTDPTPPEQ